MSSLCLHFPSSASSLGWMWCAPIYGVCLSHCAYKKFTRRDERAVEKLPFLDPYIVDFGGVSALLLRTGNVRDSKNSSSRTERKVTVGVRTLCVVFASSSFACLESVSRLRAEAGGQHNFVTV